MEPWMVISSESSVPVEKIAAESKTILWYQIFLEGDTSALRAQMADAGLIYHSIGRATGVPEHLSTATSGELVFVTQSSPIMGSS